MASVFFIRHETSYGPFFSSKEKAAAYLLKDGFEAPGEEELAEMLEGRHCYCNVVEVELDNPDISFDG